MILFAFFTLMGVTACQPTPEDLIVQQKNDGELMEAIQSTAEPVSEVPSEVASPEEGLTYKVVDHQSFTEELVNGITLTADADIMMPDVAGYPVVTYRRKVFTQGDVDRILQVLIDAKPLYQTYDRVPKTKAQIEEMIVQINLDYKDLHAPIAEMKGIKSLVELHEERDDILKDLYKMLETAPDTLDLDTHNKKLGRDGSLQGFVPFDQTTMMRLQIYNNDNGGRLCYSDIGIKLCVDEVGRLLDDVRQKSTFTSCQCFYDNMLNNLPLIPVTEKVDTMTITPQEAKDLAETAFHKVGAGEDVRVTQVYYLEIPRKDVQGYLVELKRHIGDVPIEAMASSDAGKEKRAKDANGDPFNAGIPYEIMSVYITNEGIVDFCWREPLEVVAVENANVSLASTDTVTDVFRQEFTNGWSGKSTDYTQEIAENDSLISRTIPTYDLHEVKLGYGIARKPNQSDVFMAIPLWDFYGTVSQTTVFVDPDGVEQTTSDNHTSSILTINGIDHSRFSRHWGY